MVYNLKKLRQEKGISQQKLAEVISVSQQSINKYENHNVEPDICTLTKLANYFHTSVDYLIGNTQEKEEPFSSEEQRLINAYRKLNDKEKRSIILVITNYLTLHNME